MASLQAQELRAATNLPKIPKLTLRQFVMQYRPLWEGKPNVLEFLPMWWQIYDDVNPDIFLAIARQRGKSSYLGNRLAWRAICFAPYRSGYVTYEDASLHTFVNQKYRNSIYKGRDNILGKFVRGKTVGSLHSMEFLNGSEQTFQTHASDFTHIEGKSEDEMILDEIQYLNLTAWSRLNESQSWTQGPSISAGIGGYMGSKHHKAWLETNQMEWFFDITDWYDRLRFYPKDDLEGRKGLIWGPYLTSLLKGKWESLANHDSYVHGYHLAQDQFPNVPRTIEDALNKFHVTPKQSLEWKKQDYTYDDYMRHVMAKFIKGNVKPFLREDLLKLFDRNSTLTAAADVDHSLGPLLMGIDWGGGKSAYTIFWITQRIHPTAPIMKTLYLRRIKQSDVEKQADMGINIINAYEVDQVVQDAGGGPRQTQKLEQEFGRRALKCNEIERPNTVLPRDDELDKLYRENRFLIDRTYGIETVRDWITRPHIQDDLSFPRLIIPYHTGLPGFVDQDNLWIIEHFEAIEGTVVPIKGRDYIRYEHAEDEPDDAVHAAVFNWIAHLITKPGGTWYKSL